MMMRTRDGIILRNTEMITEVSSSTKITPALIAMAFSTLLEMARAEQMPRVAEEIGCSRQMPFLMVLAPFLPKSDLRFMFYCPIRAVVCLAFSLTIRSSDLQVSVAPVMASTSLSAEAVPEGTISNLGTIFLS